MQTKLMRTVIAGLITLGFGTSAAYADTVTITLNSATITATPGSTVDFYGTVTAPATVNSGTVYLNGDKSDFYGDGTIDSANGEYDPFLDDFFTIPTGGSQTGELFTVTIGSDADAGLIPGVFAVLGGSAVNNYDELGFVDFDVNVVSAATVTPEPPTWLLLATGIVGLAGFCRTHRKASIT